MFQLATNDLTLYAVSSFTRVNQPCGKTLYGKVEKSGKDRLKWIHYESAVLIFFRAYSNT